MRRLRAEWEKQRAVLMAFPHKGTDWSKDIEGALSPFIRIAQAIAYSQAVYIICDNKESISERFCSTNNLSFIEIPTNDTWIRDYGYISIEEDGETKLLDFTFDGWGGKFEAGLDNAVNTTLHKKGYLGITPLEKIEYVLEGGSIESDGIGTILTTTHCLCNSNRNGGGTKEEVEAILAKTLGATRVLWLDYGHLEGDDTDGHIDTLVRFVDEKTITFVQCLDSRDAHYQPLQQMHLQLKRLRTKEGKPYKLIPLPMCEAIYDEKGYRLPATYANFLITNKALLYPTYGVKTDTQAKTILQSLFPDRELIPIRCNKLIEEGGSLHCSTMQVAY